MLSPHSQILLWVGSRAPFPRRLLARINQISRISSPSSAAVSRSTRQWVLHVGLLQASHRVRDHASKASDAESERNVEATRGGITDVDHPLENFFSFVEVGPFYSTIRRAEYLSRLRMTSFVPVSRGKVVATT